MSAPFIIAVPAKGRLQQNAEAFFARAGLELVKPRGARDYRGTIADLPGVEVAYLSASEITELLAQGLVHLGVTGEDLVREMIADADAKVVLIEGLGFGHANVVVAVPQAWIDVHGMADLDDVATAFRMKHDRKMRLTKYMVHAQLLSRMASPTTGSKARARRGRAGCRHRRPIVDITTTALRSPPTGSGYRGRCHPALTGQLVADARGGAPPSGKWRASCSTASRRRTRARISRVRTRFAGCDAALLAEAKDRFGVRPRSGPTSSAC